MYVVCVYLSAGVHAFVYVTACIPVSVSAVYGMHGGSGGGRPGRSQNEEEDKEQLKVCRRIMVVVVMVAVECSYSWRTSSTSGVSFQTAPHVDCGSFGVETWRQ